MSRPLSISPRQSGFALWALTFLIVLGASYSLYRLANSSWATSRQPLILAAQLRHAKEALLARAVIDENRPGSLPCPDLITNVTAMNNFPGDGRADMLAGNHCPSYLGWLPWITLDLPELSDPTGNHFWYGLSSSLRDDDSAQPLNADSRGLLTIDREDDIAAVIIAPGAVVSPQTRPSNRPSDYLEGDNAGNHKYLSGPLSPAFNDTLIAISRGELMAAVGKRLAGEVHRCLEQHAASSANISHRYPWPAPLSEESRHGRAGSLFGRIATTQPSSGPETMLKANIAGLKKEQAALAGQADAQQQLASLKALSDHATLARNIFDMVFASASKLKQSADELSAALQPMLSTIDEATSNGRISRSEGSALRALNESLTPALDHLPKLLGEFGIDVFPWELAQHKHALAKAETRESLLAATQVLSDLLANSDSPRSDLSLAIATARLSAASAQEVALAAANQDEPNLLDETKSATAQLLAATTSLAEALAATRLNVLSSDIADVPGRLDHLRTKLDTPIEAASLDELRLSLTAARDVIEGIDTGLDTIASAKNISRDALNAALIATAAAFPKVADIDGRTAQAINAIRALVAAIATNETADNNLSRTSLQAAISNYRAAQSQFTEIDTATNRPLQRDIVAPAQTLAAASADLIAWAGIIASNSSIAALQAKNEAATADNTPPTDDSAYLAAVATLDSLEASRGSIAAVQAYLEMPNSQNKRKADAAIAKTFELTQKLIDHANRLAEAVNGSTASALPMVWNSRRCDFLLPNQNNWWNNNQWSETLFYQIGHPQQTALGSLSVDGTGQYRLVVLAAGPPLPGQQRYSSDIANFLEGPNADASRNGDADAPSQQFSGVAPSPGFNDRLAY